MTPTQQLESAFVGCQLKIRWLGIVKTLTTDQTNTIAQQFDADAKLLKATKKIIDTRNPCYAALVTIRDEAKKIWREVTIPYTEPGVRLIRKITVQDFTNGMENFKKLLKDQTNQLWLHWEDIRTTAKTQLGSLYNDDDYPDFPEKCFDIEWHFVSVMPPVSLKEAYPAIYQAEVEKAQIELKKAIKLTEEAFANEFAEMVKHLQERLNDQSDGKKKVFRDSAITNLKDFFAKFEKLNIGSNDDLTKLVKDAELALLDTTAKDVRSSQSCRNYIASTMKEINTELDKIIVAKPRRKLLLSVKGEEPCGNGSPGAPTPSVTTPTNAA